MNRLDRYILKQCAIPLLLILVVVTVTVWMTQVLQRMEILVEYGQGFAVFAWLSVLIIPSLLAVIIPFALFGAAVYAIYRMHSDSEIAVMFAAGVSKIRVASPILLITLLGALATLYVNIDLMPRSYRTLKYAVADIRADFASSLLRSGEFTSVVDGFTIYIDEARPGGQFIGLLINDHGSESGAETYMAERALLTENENGTFLQLKNGNIQRRNAETGRVEIIRFEDTAVNIDNYRENPGEYQLELTERYLGELFNPDLDKPYDRQNAAKLIAEGHARLSAPLYAFAYVFVALYVLIGRPYNRRGYVIPIVIACALIFGLRVVGFVAQGLVENTGTYWLLYAIPGSAILIFSVLAFMNPHRGGAAMEPA